MAKVRVYELAKEFGVESKAVMDQLKEMGEFVRSASSTIEAPVVRRLKEAFSTKAAEQPAQRSRPAGSPAGSARAAATLRPRLAPGRGLMPARGQHPILAMTALPWRLPPPRRPPGPRPTGPPTAPRSGRPRPMAPPSSGTPRLPTWRPGRCRRSRRRPRPGPARTRGPTRGPRGLRAVPVPRGCPVRRGPRPPRLTSAVPGRARGGQGGQGGQARPSAPRPGAPGGFRAAPGCPRRSS